MEQFCEIILNLAQWFRRRFQLKISYLELWRPFNSVERYHLCNLERGHLRELSCEVI